MRENSQIVFSKALRYYLELYGKNQQDLIKDLHISSSTLSQWVNGKMFPRMDKVEMLAQYFHIATTDLLTDPVTRSTSTSADPIVIAKLVESNNELYELLKISIQLENADIHILQAVAQRLLELHRQELHRQEL